tara:strand:+ start:433 stop:585 length:153 start_codon:yes stop_codon:yes gene_type:complete
MNPKSSLLPSLYQKEETDLSLPLVATFQEMIKYYHVVISSRDLSVSKPST